MAGAKVLPFPDRRPKGLPPESLRAVVRAFAVGIAGIAQGKIEPSEVHAIVDDELRKKS